MTLSFTCFCRLETFLVSLLNTVLLLDRAGRRKETLSTHTQHSGGTKKTVLEGTEFPEHLCEATSSHKAVMDSSEV